MTENLKVQPELLGVLASHHDNAAASATSGTEVTSGVSESVTVTHGSYCSQFNTTLKMYESTRSALGSSLNSAGIDLAKNLRTAARAYTEADDTWSKALGSLFS